MCCQIYIPDIPAGQSHYTRARVMQFFPPSKPHLKGSHRPIILDLVVDSNNEFFTRRTSFIWAKNKVTPAGKHCVTPPKRVVQWVFFSICRNVTLTFFQMSRWFWWQVNSNSAGLSTELTQDLPGLIDQANLRWRHKKLVLRCSLHSITSFYQNPLCLAAGRQRSTRVHTSTAAQWLTGSDHCLFKVATNGKGEFSHHSWIFFLPRTAGCTGTTGFFFQLHFGESNLIL